MVYLLDNDTLKADAIENINSVKDRSQLCIISFDELKSESNKLGVNERIVNECFRSGMSKFESHEGLDFIVLDIPDDIDQLKNPQRTCIYLTNKLLLFVSDDHKLLDDIIAEIETEKTKNISSGKILHLFFDKLTFDDALILEKIEQDISELEEKLITSEKSDLIDDFVTFRKKLLTLKRYYEQLLEISEAIEQNENGLIDKTVLRYFKILTNRVNRLFSSVLNLRDYVTQVREAYQAQMDINLNKVMKFFTVITSIFLPSTLIVGWYGMNLKMPEYGWNYGYPFVIGIVIGTAVVSLIYFKKHKWF